MSSARVVRLLIADDSATLRRALCEFLSREPRVQVVGEARDGLEAVELCRALRPDVVTMDVQMPRLDGLSATARIMEEAPARVLMVCSVSEGKAQDLSYRALAAGALELLPKPARGALELRAWGERVVQAVLLMAEVPVVRRLREQAPAAAGTTAAGSMARLLRAGDGLCDAVGIVASTGGPPALARLLAALPEDLPAPVLIAQHIAAGFTAGLVRWFASASRLPVAIANEGERARPGHVYLPPDNRDLELDARFLLRTPRSAGPSTPSGNRLLHSLAKSLGARAAGVVLTGMGDDGAQGLAALRRAGGTTFAQDESSSVVFGMPHAAIALGAAQSVLSLDEIAPQLVELFRTTKAP